MNSAMKKSWWSQRQMDAIARLWPQDIPTRTILDEVNRLEGEERYRGMDALISKASVMKIARNADYLLRQRQESIATGNVHRYGNPNAVQTKEWPPGLYFEDDPRVAPVVAAFRKGRPATQIESASSAATTASAATW